MFFSVVVTDKEEAGDYAEVPCLTSPEPVSFSALLLVTYNYLIGGCVIRSQQ